MKNTNRLSSFIIVLGGLLPILGIVSFGWLPGVVLGYFWVNYACYAFFNSTRLLSISLNGSRVEWHVWPRWLLVCPGPPVGDPENCGS